MFNQISQRVLALVALSIASFVVVSTVVVADNVGRTERTKAVAARKGPHPQTVSPGSDLFVERGSRTAATSDIATANAAKANARSNGGFVAPAKSSSGAARVRISGRQLFKTKAPRELGTPFTSESAVAGASFSRVTRALTLATADFNLDGAPDLVAGYATDAGGVVTYTSGNVDAFAPREAATFSAIQKGNMPPAFGGETRALAVPEAPEFLFAGDFNRDGLNDILTAVRRGSFYLFAGNGAGKFEAPLRVEMGGAITAVGVGTFGLGGMKDVVVAINGPSGPEALVYKQAAGGLFAAPVEYSLPAAATSIAFGDMDKDSAPDVALATGKSLTIIHGSAAVSKDADSERLEQVELPFEARAISLGYFIFNREQRKTFAVLSTDGTIYLLQPRDFDTRAYSAEELKAQSVGDQEVLRVTQNWDARPVAEWSRESATGWQVGKQLGASVPVITKTAVGPSLMSSFVTYQPTADLFIVNSANNRVELHQHLDQGDNTKDSMAFDMPGQPTAFLEMPRQVNGQRDLILLQADSVAPAVVPILAATTITVDRTDDPTPIPSACTAAGNDCSLRGAVAVANSGSSSPTTINIPAGTYSLTLDGAGEDANATGDLDLLAAATGVSFVGAGAATTIIQDSTASEDRIMQVTPGTNPVAGWTGTWVGLTMQNGGDNGGAILSGGAILMGGTDNVYNLSSCTFNNNVVTGNVASNGGAIAQSAKQTGGIGTGNYNNDTFTNNRTQTGVGGGLRVLGGTTSQGTEAINITGGRFDNNEATTNEGGGVFLTIQSGTSTFTKITFTNNKALDPNTDTGGGGIQKSNGTLNLSFSRFRDNTVSAMGRGEGVKLGGNGDLNATNNWWGCNTDPFETNGGSPVVAAAGCDSAFKVSTVTGNLITLPQLVLKNTASPAPIVTGQDTTLTASVNTNSANADVSANVILLADLPVTWNNAVRGNLSNQQTTLQSLTRNISSATESGSTVTITTSAAHGFSTGQTVLIAGVTESRYTGVFVIASTPTTTTFTYANTITGLGASSGGTAKVSVGTATATFRASAAGAGAADATVDSAVATANFTINKADTTSTITSDTPDPTVTGQSFTVNFSLSVNAPGSNNPTVPTGSVTVTADTGETCNGSINSATPAIGSCSITIFHAGNRTLTAAYGGDANFNISPASSPATAHVVNKADTTTAITNSVALGTATVTGQSYAVNYSVSVTSPGSAGGTFNSGMVQVSDGVSTCTGTVAAGTCNLTSTSAGAKTITATYLGDANYNASPASSGVAHTVNPANTTTTITNSVALGTATVVGQSYAVNWSVSVNAPGSLGVAMTGNVTVSDGTQTCMAAVSAGTCNLTSTTAGAKTITATYGGDSNYNASPASTGVPHTVNKANTTAAILTDLPDPSVTGQSVTVTYSVAVTAPGAGTPTGNVDIKDGATIICTGTVAAGQCSGAMNIAGARTLTATYQGDTDFNASPASPGAAHQVNKADTTASISSTVPNPSVTGQTVQVNFSVLVTAPGGGTPTGNVVIMDGASTFCMATVATGNCSAAFTSAGAKTLTATYQGDSNYNASPASSGFPHQVNLADTTASITNDTPDPSTPGQAVTVSYSVAVTAPGGGTPTGNVMVTDGVDSCTGTVSAGSCMVTLNTPGNRTLTATYQGDANYNASPPSTGVPHFVGVIKVLISEFRFRGSRTPSGAQDEFIELYNNSDSQVVVPAGGWTLRSIDTGGITATVFTVPAATTIPGRGHFLVINNTASVGFSLGGYPAGAATIGTGDGQYTGIDIADGGGIALFNSGTVFDATTKLDAVGFTTAPDPLYREGAGLSPAGGVTADGEFSFTRKLTKVSSGTPQDTDNNANDFAFVSNTGGTFSGLVSTLGAPGPENLASPIQRNLLFGFVLLDSMVSSTSSPNRVRDFTGVPNGVQGTLKIRRTLTNNTGAPVTRLRFRIVDITTFAGTNPPAGVAELRVLTSSTSTVTLTGGSMVTVEGLTLETPPTQAAGGGLNSSLAAGTITMGTPLAIGASINVEFLLGVQQAGTYRFFINIEALP